MLGRFCTECHLPLDCRELWLSISARLGSSSCCSIFFQYWTRLLLWLALTAPCTSMYLVSSCSLAAFSRNPIYWRITLISDLQGGVPIIIYVTMSCILVGSPCINLRSRSNILSRYRTSSSEDCDSKTIDETWFGICLPSNVE